MENPINDSVFDTRDLIEYRDYLASQLVDLWNDTEGTSDHPADDVNEILGTGGYEFADDIKDAYAGFEETNEDEIKEYLDVAGFCDDLASSPDFEHGEGVIHEDYFMEYTKELLVDCGYIPKDMPEWIEIDYEATAENVKVDYSEYQFQGDSYFIRA